MEQLDFRSILTRRAEWEGDVLHVNDMIRDVVNGVEQQIESSVLNHFDMDFTDLREYLRDKETWRRKQETAIPKWIQVTERLPETNEKVLVYVFDPDFCGPYIEFGHWLNWLKRWGEFDDEVGDFGDYTIIAWMPLPEPPKEEKEAENENHA